MIREARRAAGMSQRLLAERAGVPQPNIAAYETGRRTPSAATTAKLLGAAKARASVDVRRHREEIVRIARANRATRVRVFGSVARGTDTPDSDIDLLVAFDDEATVLDQAALVEELERLLHRHVDVVSEGALRPRDEHIRGEAVALGA